jgi:hypothetical protein
MTKLFSKRYTPPPARYRYDLPDDIRWRIIHSIEQLTDEFCSRFDIDRMLQEVGERILREYGGLLRPGYDAARVSNHPIVEHFFSSNEEMALDFIEMCFQVWGHCGQQKGVDAINEVFRDAGIGYELTPFIEIQTNKPGSLFGRP